MGKSGGASQHEAMTGRTGGERRAGVAVAMAIAALTAGIAGSACVSRAPGPRAQAAMRTEVDKGLVLYRAGDFELAAGRFEAAAEEARRCRDLRGERLTRTAECAAWLRAGKSKRLGTCTARLELLQLELGESESGVNTLLGLGAIARGERLPPFRLPGSVRSLLEETAAGGA